VPGGGEGHSIAQQLWQRQRGHHRLHDTTDLQLWQQQQQQLSVLLRSGRERTIFFMTPLTCSCGSSSSSSSQCSCTCVREGMLSLRRRSHDDTTDLQSA
jgi:hypothetical protein